MIRHSTQHGSFTIERHLSAPPAQVFTAWSNPDIKGRWFAGPYEWSAIGYKLDFRIGGHEYMASGSTEGPMHIYDARIEDIVPNERIVYSYERSLDDKRISVSLATVELEPDGDGTYLVFTEQDVFLDDADNETSRVQETTALLDKLESVLRHERQIA